MKVVADLHIHSRYALATSKHADLDHLALGAKAKGITLLGTGDFTHPKWLAELREKLEPLSDSALFTYGGRTWMLSAEVSTVYEQEGRTRKVHHLIYAPGFDEVAQLNDIIGRHGRLDSDGRPVLTGMDSAELAEAVTEVSSRVVVIPAHAWTPWFGVFGSRSGFDSLKECYKDQAGKIFALETGLSCYDDQTEVLTKAGWKKFSGVSSQDSICTLNTESDRIEYQSPTRTISSHYSGRMYRLKTKRVDLFVTPNHNLLVTQFATRGTRPFRLKTAEEVFGKSKTFKKDAAWSGQSSTHFALPSARVRHGSRHYQGYREVREREFPIRIWVEFLGWWVAEGHTSEGKGGDYNVILSNSNRRVIKRFVKLFELLGYKPSVLEPQAGRFQVRIRNYQLFSYLKKLGQSHEKFVPIEIKGLTKELLMVFLRSYLKGDGHVYGRTGKGLSATTTSPRLRDDLQEIALKVGMSAYYKLGARAGTPIRSLHSGKYKSSHDAWIVFFIRRGKTSVVPSLVKKGRQKESWESFDGRVYCLSVPNRVMYVRRNGIPVWCGNSDPEMNWRLSALDGLGLMSNSDAHSPNPWRLGREANVFDLPVPGYRELFDAVRGRDPTRFLYTVEVDPSYGKYHYSGHKKCGVSLAPGEAKGLGNRCPRCGKRLTVGVLQRVEELADRPEGFRLPGAVPFKRLLPLYEVISLAIGVNHLYAKSVLELQDKLIARFGNEFDVLVDVPEGDLAAVVPPRVARAIVGSREGRVKVVPGYDGVYGVPVFTG